VKQTKQVKQLNQMNQRKQEEQAQTRAQVVGANQGDKDPEQAGYKPNKYQQEEEGEAAPESSSSYEPY
jgi:hypothetical protein